MQVTNYIALSPLVPRVACNLANAYEMCDIGVYAWVRGVETQKKNLRLMPKQDYGTGLHPGHLFWALRDIFIESNANNALGSLCRRQRSSLRTSSSSFRLHGNITTECLILS